MEDNININNNNTYEDKIKEVDLRKTMEESYIDYAMSVITDRAVPDVRDGLKPVQRRVLYALSSLGITPDKKTKKCATIVGETMGKYHPHGDSSIYGALVYMGQPWNLPHVLIDKQGNFGSEDGDGPAAMRYTEAKMSKVAAEMVDGINKDTVDFVPNFSAEYEEPTVLPGKFPNLIVNGTVGIAVGYTTNIPPHNLNEVISAIDKIIEDKIEGKNTSVDDIINLIKGPDFPTGALVMGKSGIEEYLRTGHGRIKLRAKVETEIAPNGRAKIIIRELPYAVYRTDLSNKIADLANEKKIEGIADIVDVYGKNSTAKLEIPLKKGANVNVVLNQLYKHTELQTTFSVYMFCIVDGTPKTLNILEILNEYLKHQINVVTRRTKFDLNKCEERNHIVEGLLKALDIIDEIIATIRSSGDPEEARNNLITKFGFTDRQAQAIVDMRLRALTNLERGKLDEEHKDLLTKIKYYRELLSDDKKMLSVIKTEIDELSGKYGIERRTQIVLDSSDEILEKEDLIADTKVMITMTNLGYIKRMEPDTFKTQSRGGRGVKSMQTMEEDFVKEVFVSSTLSTLMFFTNKGRMFKLKGYEIPEGSRTAKGTAIVNMLKLDSDEIITAGCDVRDFSDDKYLYFATRKGIIKKTALSEYAKTRSTGLNAINLKDDDRLIGVVVTSGKDDIVLVSRKGLIVKFKDESIRDMGRTARGVKGMNLKEGDELIDMLSSSQGKYILFVTENGIGKKCEMSEFATKSRGGKGMICYKPDEKTGMLVDAKVVNDDDDVIIVNSSGTLIRLHVNKISAMGRGAKGVRLMANDDGSKITSVSNVPKE